MEKQLIIIEPCAGLRARGREALAGRWKEGAIAAAIFMACTQIPVYLLDSLFGRVYYAFGEEIARGTALSGIYMLLIYGPFVFGITLYFMNMFRKKETDHAQLFSGFEYFVKTFCLMLVMGIFIFLWTLLFIVPGIIATIRYSQAFLILVDDQTKGIMQCIDESKRRMAGNKLKYFCLQLSFIGWLILATLPATIISSIFGLITGNYFIMQIGAFIGGAGLFFVYAYMYTSMVGFYEILTGRLKGETYTPGEY